MRKEKLLLNNMLEKKIKLIEESLIKELEETITFEAKLRYFIKKIEAGLIRTVGKTRFVNDRIFFWINGLYADGLLACIENDNTALDILNKFYSFFIRCNKMRIKVFELPDQIIHANIMLYLYIKYNQRQYLNLIQEAAAFIYKESERNKDKLIYYRPNNEKIYLDSLGMIEEFCYLYSIYFTNPLYTQIADAQIQFTIRNCMDRETSMPYHSYHYGKKRGEGSSLWGRGIGWYLVGITNKLKYNFDEKVFKEYCRTIDFLCQFQNTEGYLPDEMYSSAHIDTSITAMAGYCTIQGIIENWFLEINKEKYVTFCTKCVQALLLSTDEKGLVNDCSGECKKPGSYSPHYGNYYAQSYTLKLFKEFLEV